MIELFDTHCHIHFSDYPLGSETVIAAAHDSQVSRLLCVGCTLTDSKLAVQLAMKHANIWATIGLHPHEAKLYVEDPRALNEFARIVPHPKVVGVGEAGLDYYYNHSSPEAQITLLRFQIELALQYKLPIVFHVREAFDDFWQVFDSYQGIRGVVHSFSATQKELDKTLERGLYIGLNGIMTFTKNDLQLVAAKSVPLSKLLLETDAPFLTPSPYRGTICEPKHVRVTAEFLSNLRGESLEQLAAATTQNANTLFGLEKK